MTKNKAILIHGWEGNPDVNWLPWLKHELEKRSFEVTVPALPDPNYPKSDEWLQTMTEQVGLPSPDTVLVGHSLGAIAILHFLESLPENVSIRGVILVSGFAESLGYPETNNFFDTPVDFSKITPHLERAIVINSDNDPYVPLELGHSLAKSLGAEFILMPGAGHINKAAGFTECPLILESVLDLFNLDEPSSI